MGRAIRSRLGDSTPGKLFVFRLSLRCILIPCTQAGSHSAISDTTPVGGWTILDCEATSADQEIRLVCHDPTKCGHLYLNGAENTVVRLPDDVSML